MVWVADPMLEGGLRVAGDPCCRLDPLTMPTSPSGLPSNLVLPSEQVPPILPPRASKAALLAHAADFAIPLPPHATVAEIREILATTANARLKTALANAHAAGLAAAARVPPGLACGSGFVKRRGDQDFVADPLLDSPYGQDYDRHGAYTRAAAVVLCRYGIDAVARVHLD